MTDHGFPSRIWITGAGGLVGSWLTRLAPTGGVVGLTRAELDLTDFAAVERRFRADEPGLVIHCAALSRSPEAQADPGRARKINVDATAHLAGLAREAGFVFFSTDQVFDGRKGGYVETDAPNPLGIYGETKLAAEREVLKNPRHMVARLALCGGVSLRGAGAFNEELAAAWGAGKTVKLFHDEYRTPIAAPVAARAMWELAAGGRAGLWHLGGSERLSRLEIGRLVAARHPELNARMESVSRREYVGAPRPADGSLDCAKLRGILSFPLSGLGAWLRENPEAPF